MPPPETGNTFLENALIKARNAATTAGLPAIADDSGIEVDALGGAPGVHSARFAGEDASDEANLTKLLAALEGLRRRCERLVTAASSCLSKASTIRSPWSARASGRATSSRRGADMEASVTTHASFRSVKRAPSRKCRPPKSTARAIAGRRCAHSWRSSRRGQRRENPAAVAVCALSVVRAEMPVLRFQLVHPEGGIARTALHRRVAARSRRAGACRCRAPAGEHFSWWRHAEPVLACRDRASSRTRTRAAWFCRRMEVTLEANPGTIERGRFSEYRAAGVTRVSLGAQSFDARQLKLLGRIHSADETRRAAEELHAAGLANFNLDLDVCAAGPDGGRRGSRSARRAGASPAHVSQYHLTIEPGTVFAAAPPTQPDDEIVDEMLDRSLQLARSRGLRAVRSFRICARRRALRAQPQLLELSATTWVSALARTARFPIPSRELIVRTQQTREPRRYLAAEPGCAGAQADLDPGFAVRVRHEWLPAGGGLFRTTIRSAHRAGRRRPGTCAGARSGPRPG